MHKPYEVLKGITLPGECGMVSGRIYNFLRELNQKIKPASCITVELDTEDFGAFFIKIATFLTESAGVSIIVDRYPEFESKLKALPRNGQVDIVDASLEKIKSDQVIVRVADSLMLRSEKSQTMFPDHLSIFSTWALVFDTICRGTTVTIDFQDIREPDDLSTGKTSFMALCQQIVNFTQKPSLTAFLKCLSDICATIKRGGFRRHGAVTSSLKSTSPLIDEYLDIPFGYLSHLKKGVCIVDLNSLALIEKLLDLQNKGNIFFEKYLGTSHGWDFKKNAVLYNTPKELRTNVCRGIALLPDDQCLVSPVNLGMCKTYNDIRQGFAETTEFLVDVHKYQVANGFPLLDKQIAVGLCGLANMLRNFEVPYPDFIEKLTVFRTAYIDKQTGYDLDYTDIDFEWGDNLAYRLVKALSDGIKISARIGRSNGMRATIAIEPNESCSRRYKDFKGYDLCPNIDPPNVVPGVGIEKRHSQTGVFDNQGALINPEFNYGADIFPAQYLTEEQHFLLWDNILAIINNTGQAHSGSYEMWGQWTMVSFLKWWNSQIKFVYYNRTVGTTHLVKGRAISAREKMLREPICSINTREVGCSECD